MTQTAKNVALDFLRREQRWNAKQDSIAAEHERWLSVPPGNDVGETLVDDTLRMMFVCFHPQLSTEAQNALALRIVCGLSAAEIAAAYLTTEAAITALNRAIAISRVHGPQAGLNALDDINRRGTLETYRLYHVTRGTFHADLGQAPPALTHFHQAATLATLPAEKAFIAHRIAELH